MNRLSKYTSAAFGMALLVGLAYYQGDPKLATGDPGSLVGTAVLDAGEAADSTVQPASDTGADVDCDFSDESEDPDFETCDKITQK